MSSPADDAYLKKHGFPELLDNMLGAVVTKKPDDAIGFCIDYLTQEKQKAMWRLAPHPVIPRAKKPVVVCILDGWGESTVKDEYNAVYVAKTPNYDRLMSVEGRARIVLAHGKAVGLPSDDDMGNSEVGHNALGSGQVVDQGAKLVDNALGDGSIFTTAGWHSIEPSFAGHTVHLIGLLSKGGVHARFDQMVQLVAGAASRGAGKIRLHVLTDGRDVVDGTSIEYAEELEKEIEKIHAAHGTDIKVASGGGRMFVTMDRYEADWGIVERGWKAHVLGEAEKTFGSLLEAVTELRKDGTGDQFLPPFVITEGGVPVGTINDGDAVVTFNFRSDRMVELSKAFEYDADNFSYFDRKRTPNINFVGMMQYDGDLKLPTKFLVDAPCISRVSGEFLCKNGVRTFACSETQKFGHVTFFWNGNRSGYVDSSLETYFEEPSDKVVFDEKPDMKAHEVTAAAIEAVKSGKFDMIRVNYANPDMVGHTGNLKATVQACETVDSCLGKLLEAVEAVEGRWLVTADHGNADDMVQREKKTFAPQKDKEGNLVPCKSHTLAPVPVCIGGSLPSSVKFKPDSEFDGKSVGLANITATYISLLGFTPPSFYKPALI